ncbi:MAG: RNA polymerase factor sigma-32 [Alphaproteobacteria bacterium]|nr:RNA polymerase factor sigma-32 [Alphaproteobacteria bacterium]
MSEMSHPIAADKLDRRFLSAAMRSPMLSPERERLLAERWRHQGDKAALDELVSAYLKLVISISGRFRAYGLPPQDLVQEGTVGLMQAAARFEPEREVRFSTYAAWWIRSAIQEYVLRNWSIVRSGSSASQKALFFNLRWLKAKLERDGDVQGRLQANGRISEALGVSLREVERMSDRLAQRDQSLNATLGEGGQDEIGDFLVDPGPTPEEIVLDRREFGVRRDWLGHALTKLSERERIIVDARFLQEDRLTLDELGQRLGITKERVRQIEHKAFEKLRESVLKLAAAPPAAGA